MLSIDGKARSQIMLSREEKLGTGWGMGTSGWKGGLWLHVMKRKEGREEEEEGFIKHLEPFLNIKDSCDLPTGAIFVVRDFTSFSLTSGRHASWFPCFLGGCSFSVSCFGHVLSSWFLHVDVSLGPHLIYTDVLGHLFSCCDFEYHSSGWWPNVHGRIHLTTQRTQPFRCRRACQSHRGQNWTLNFPPKPTRIHLLCSVMVSPIHPIAQPHVILAASCPVHPHIPSTPPLAASKSDSLALFCACAEKTVITGHQSYCNRLLRLPQVTLVLTSMTHSLQGG